MDIHSLILEVTRKCNISCDHCLRGEPLNVNLKKEYIDTLLDQTSYIGTVTFTGGEPTLNVPIMEYFLEQCKQRNISIDGFYVATNGMNVPESFVMFCLKMFSYCSDKEMCRIDVSNDMYHRSEGSYDESLLKGLSFYGKKFEKDGFDYNRGTSLIKQGRSYKGHEIKVVDEKNIDLEYFENELDIYLNCKGEIINGCDWSYNSQKEHKLCDVGDLELYYKNLQMIEMGVD